MNTHRVMMQIDGQEVPSSCVFCGTLKACQVVAARMNRSKTKHASVNWKVEVTL